MDEPSKKIENMNVLSYYLNKKNKEDYSLFLDSIKNTPIEDIKEIEELQKQFIKEKPAKIKYENDYLWQIYYIERTNKYYMVVPLQESKQQAFLYLLKKKIEDSKEEIYVPICNLDYDNEFMENNRISKLENYLFYFTNNWTNIYEVYKKSKLDIDIVGQLNIHEGIISDYKLHFEKKEDANNFYNLVRSLFQLQTELGNYFKFEIIVDETAGIHFHYNDKELANSNLKQFYIEEIKNNLESVEKIEKIQKELTLELNKLKVEERKLNANLLNKQKQISTFLECKKTFFGRVKYFFKYSKKRKMSTEEMILDEFYNVEDNGTIKHTYYENLDDLIYLCKELKAKTILASTTRLDVQNLKIRVEILKKKIENATLYIEEIESHKKSIFEFWKFTNKDEKNQLSEGIISEEKQKKIEKTLNLEELEDFGKQMDLIQRKILTEEEQESVLIAGTNLLKDLNLILNEKSVKFKAVKENLIKIDEKNLEHREAIKRPEIFFGMNKEEITEEEYIKKLKKVIKSIEKALKKNTTNVNLPLYGLAMPKNEIVVWDMNPKNLIKEGKEINLYKLNVKQGTNLIAFTNIIFFNNRNQTLPVGMNYSSKALLDLRNVKIKKQEPKSNHIVTLQENSSEKKVTKINIINLEIEK